MMKYEHCMTRYELVGNELNRVAPTLQPNERELIPEFHDESSFHVFEHMSSVWYVLQMMFQVDLIMIYTIKPYKLYIQASFHRTDSAEKIKGTYYSSIWVYWAWKWALSLVRWRQRSD